jgi:hypothetical protein
MRQWSADRVKLGWNLLDFENGLAAGSFVTIANRARTFSGIPTGYGLIKRSYNPDRSGVLTILVASESRLQQQLITLHNADKLTHSVVFPFAMSDLDTGERHIFGKAYIATLPNLIKATAGSSTPWEFEYERHAVQSFDFGAGDVGV